jgi:hypothetical protein
MAAEFSQGVLHYFHMLIFQIMGQVMATAQTAIRNAASPPPPPPPAAAPAANDGEGNDDNSNNYNNGKSRARRRLVFDD